MMTSARTVAQRSWQWMLGLPRVVHIVIWIFLVVVWAGPTFLLVFAPVAAGLWLWERSRAEPFDLFQWSRHLFEMVIAMFVGMFVYRLLVVTPVTAVGLRSAVSGDLGYAWMTVSMVVGMIVLMRWQGHTWRMANEMSVGMVAPIVVCFGLVRLGICPLVPFLAWLTPSTVYAAAYYGMLLGMIAIAVYRRGMYGQRATVHMPHRAGHSLMAAAKEAA
jgi:hypothetical protein